MSLHDTSLPLVATVLTLTIAAPEEETSLRASEPAAAGAAFLPATGARQPHADDRGAGGAGGRAWGHPSRRWWPHRPGGDGGVGGGKGCRRRVAAAGSGRRRDLRNPASPERAGSAVPAAPACHFALGAVPPRARRGGTGGIPAARTWMGCRGMPMRARAAIARDRRRRRACRRKTGRRAGDRLPSRSGARTVSRIGKAGRAPRSRPGCRRDHPVALGGRRTAPIQPVRDATSARPWEGEPARLERAASCRLGRSLALAPRVLEPEGRMSRAWLRRRFVRRHAGGPGGLHHRFDGSRTGPTGWARMQGRGEL